MPATEWCDAEVLRTLRRRSLAALRKEVEPVPVEALASFLPAWQQVGGRLRGVDGVLRVVEQLQGAQVPASALESLVLPARVPDYSPAHARRAVRAPARCSGAGTARCPAPTAGSRCTSPTPRP